MSDKLYRLYNKLKFLSVNNYYDKFIVFFMALFFSLFSLPDAGKIGSQTTFFLLFILFFVSFIYIVYFGGRISVLIPKFIVGIFLFSLYCMASSFWAIDYFSSIIKFKVIVSQVIILIFFCNVLKKCNDSVDTLLNIFMFSGFFVGFLVIYNYGFIYLFENFIIGNRMNSSVINANGLGLTSASSILISFYYLITKKRRSILYYLIILFNSFFLILSGSKKAIIFAFIGLSYIWLIKIINSKDKIKSFLILSLTAALVVTGICIITNLPIMNDYSKRLYSLYSLITGKLESVSLSDQSRSNMFFLGIKIFLSHPFIGIGIDNAKFIVKDNIGLELYLHNNYVELLSGGGLLGFCIYYYFFIVFGIKFVKNFDIRNLEFQICFILLLMKFLMDFGMVSYESFGHYLYLVLFFNYFYKNNSIYKNFRFKGNR